MITEIKTKIIKDRSGIGVPDSSGYYPPTISSIRDIYKMSYVEAISQDEILNANEISLLGLINKKIYVVSTNGIIKSPYIRGTLMNVFIRNFHPLFYEKYKLLFDD